MRSALSVSSGFLAAALVSLAFPAPLSAADEPIYKPPARGTPASRVGGGSRGTGDESPRLAVLAPDHTGLTTKEQPSLYWFVSKPAAAKIEVTVINDQAVAPMLEKNIDAPKLAGIQRLRLADYGIKLQPGIEYRWHVALVLDPAQRSNDIIASGTIQRVALDAPLAAKLAKTAKARLPFAYAEEGLWYDAIEAVSELIAENPPDKTARLQRARMLDQVGLEDAAQADRQAK
ncbi:MAG: DUF928 domain-containing protein [Betaproteobacteria bacterium]|nr:DUF928 domain-containing protein [Betaproteobacteria bacterium]